MDVSLVGSELVTSAVEIVDHASETTITLALEPVLGGVHLDVAWAVEPDRLRLHPFTEMVVGTYAQRWGTHCPHHGAAVWAEFRKPGGAIEVRNATDEEVLERARSDEGARAEVFRRWAPMADQIARRYRHAGIEQPDLRQAAYLAIMKAVERYDPEAGDFERYAAATVSGELKRQLRDKAWSVRVPRPVQNTALQVTRARRELGQRLGRSPSVEELAAELDLSPRAIREGMLAGQSYWSRSLDAPIGCDIDLSFADVLGEDDSNLTLAEQWLALVPVIEYLTDDEKTILHMRFFEDLTQREIGERIGVSQMQVSRLLTRIFEKVRLFLVD